MAGVDIKISELSSLQTINDNDVFPATANGITTKASAGLIKKYVVGDTDISGIGNGTPTGAISTINEKAEGVSSELGKPDAFNSGISYAIGKFCIHDDTIYCCISAVSSGSAFNAAQWQAVTIWDLVTDIPVNFGTISSLPITRAVDGILPGHRPSWVEFGTPSAATDDWTVNTETPGYVTISGSISGSTTLKIKFSMSRPEVIATTV